MSGDEAFRKRIIRLFARFLQLELLRRHSAVPPPQCSGRLGPQRGAALVKQFGVRITRRRAPYQAAPDRPGNFGHELGVGCFLRDRAPCFEFSRLSCCAISTPAALVSLQPTRHPAFSPLPDSTPAAFAAPALISGLLLVGGEAVKGRFVHQHWLIHEPERNICPLGCSISPARKMR